MALMAPSPESFLQTRQRVLGTRNGTVRKRDPEFSNELVPISDSLPPPDTCTRAQLASSDELDGTDESDDELFLARYSRAAAAGLNRIENRVNNRVEKRIDNRIENQIPTRRSTSTSRGSSRALDPPVIPGAHGPLRLSPSGNRTRVTIQSPTSSADLPLAFHEQIGSNGERASPCMSPQHRNTTSSAPKNALSGRRSLFPKSSSLSTNRRDGSSQRGLGAAGALKGAAAPLWPVEGCWRPAASADAAFLDDDADDVDDEWAEEDYETIMHYNRGNLQDWRTFHASNNPRPATASAGSRGGGPLSVDECGAEGSYLRASTFQGRHEKPPVVSYLRPQTATTELWGNSAAPLKGAVAAQKGAGVPQKGAMFMPKSAMFMPKSASLASSEASHRSGHSSPLYSRTAILSTPAQQAERADSPNLKTGNFAIPLRGLGNRQPDLLSSSSSADPSPVSGPRPSRRATLASGDGSRGTRLMSSPDAIRSGSRENTPHVLVTPTQQPLERRANHASALIPRSATVDTRPADGDAMDKRDTRGSPRSRSARLGRSEGSRMAEEFRQARSINSDEYPDVLACRPTDRGVSMFVGVEAVIGSRTLNTSLGRTNYSRQMAQAAAAARGGRVL